MSRNTSLTLRQAVNAQETGQVFLILLTIDHAQLSVPIRVSSDAVNTVSNGDTYYAYPFEITLPDDMEDRPPRARLRIDNVSREIIASIRSIQTAPTLNIDIVLASDPDTVEVHLPDFQMRNITYDAMTIDAEINIDYFIEEPFPAGTFAPSYFKGLF